MAAADANPRLSVGYALGNNALPSTLLDAQRASMLADQLQNTTQAAEQPVGIGSAIANGLAAILQRKQLEGMDAKLIGDGYQGQQATLGTLAGNIGMGAPGVGQVAPPPQLQPQPTPPAGAGADPSVGAAASAMGGGAPPQSGAPPPSIGAMPASAPVPPPPPAGGGGQGPQQGFPGAPAQAASAAARVGPPVSPQDRDALIRMVYGEARGEPAAGQAATAAVALNRSILSGHPVASVVNAPGQFEGMRVGAGLDPNSPQYQKIAAVVDPLLTGNQPDPSAGATHFYSPGAQAALGRNAPAWDNGSGRQIGNQLFFRLPYGDRSGTPAGMPPGTYEVAQNGPLGPMPSSAAAQLGPQGGPDPGQGGGQSAPAPPLSGSPQAPQQVYGNGATALEQQTIRSYLASPNPQLREQAVSMMQTIGTRMRTPVDYDEKFDPATGTTTYIPKTPGQGPIQLAGAPGGYRPPPPSSMMWGLDGSLHPMPGTMMSAPQRVSPGAVSQQDPFGKATYSAVPGLAGEAPAGTSWNGHAYVPTPGASPGAPQQIPGTDTVAQRMPDGSLKSVGSVSLTPKDLQTIQSGYAATEEAKNYTEALAARQAMGVAAGQANGAGDYAMLDTYARAINPGAVARLGTIEAIKQSRDVPAQIRGEVQHWGPNGGTLSPSSREQLLATTDGFVQSRWQALQPRLQDAAAFAQRNGVPAASVVPTFRPPSGPAMPNLGAIPSGAGSVQGGNGGPGVQPNSNGGGGAPGGVAGAQGRLSPAQAASLPHGARFQGADGVWRIRQ